MILFLAAVSGALPGTTSIAGTIVAAWSAATVFWMGVGGAIWRLLFEPRLKDMKALLERERTRCDVELDTLRDRIKLLETLLLLHGPAALRQQMQLALSEKEMDLQAIKHEREGD